MIGQFFDTMVVASSDKEWSKWSIKIYIIQFSLNYLSSGRFWEDENKRKFQTFGSKNGRGRL